MMLPHHLKLDVCENRPKYRQGRKYTAVKVYSVCDESRYLLILGVTTLGISKELHSTCSAYGDITALSVIEDYPSEKFTKAYLLKYENINSARVAKKRLDELVFYGGVIHICYAPEYETVDETRWKLQERRLTIAKKCRQLEEEEELGRNKSGDHSKASHPSTPKGSSSHTTQSLKLHNRTTSSTLSAGASQSQHDCITPSISSAVTSYSQQPPNLFSTAGDGLGPTHHGLTNPYFYPVADNYSYPSTIDNTVGYRYQMKSSDCPEVEPVQLVGLGSVTTDNLNQVELRYDAVKQSAEQTQGYNKRQHKHRHSAAEAAAWHTSNFGYTKAKVQKLGKTSDSKSGNEGTNVSFASDDGGCEKTVVPIAPAKSAITHSQLNTFEAPAVGARVHSQPDLSVAPAQIVIRPLQPPEGPSTPRFVPRQLSASMKAEALAGHEFVLKNSTKLGKVQEARLPKDIEEEFRSASGQHIADDTTLDIRNKIKQVFS